MSSLAPASLHAQADGTDAIYLKDGTIYKGKIVEQTAGDNYVIRTKDGILVKVFVTNIDHVTIGAADAQPEKANDDKHYDGTIGAANRRVEPTPTYRGGRRSFVYRDKGYFFQGHLLIGGLEIGLHVINGYKFHQFAYLGVGFGFDAVVFAPVANVDYMGFQFTCLPLLQWRHT